MYPFTEGSFAPRNGWYVAAHAAEIARAPLARDILGEPVVLYRREDGRAVAVGGRCPHRHYPLGCGSLRGDAIVCGYHGIAFGDDGRCVSIPTQAGVPGAVRIPSYPLVEHGLWLFIWMGDAESADPALLPDLAEIGLGLPNMRGRGFFVDEVKARYQLLNDNLLDLSHVAFLHSSSIGTEEDAQPEEHLTKRDGIVGSRRYTRNSPAPPINAVSGLYSGLIDRVLGLDFYLPGLHAGFADMHYAQDHPDHAGECFKSVWFYHAITPVSAKTTRYFFAVAMDAGDAEFEQMRRITRAINDEDIAAAERIEIMLGKLDGPPRDLLLRADRNAVEGRRMLQAMIDRERGTAAAPARRAAATA